MVGAGPMGNKYATECLHELKAGAVLHGAQDARLCWPAQAGQDAGV